MSIGENIIRRRKEAKLTQSQLAEMIGVSFQAVSSWERNEYVPETGKLQLLAETLHTTVSALLGETEAHASFINAPERLFLEDHMYTQVKSAANAHGLMQTAKALPFAKQQHAGQVRKGKDNIPYISHPLTMACHALAMGIVDDDVLAAVLLHDVCEDCGVSPEELPVGEAVQQAVTLLTKTDHPGMSKQQANDLYYAALRENRIAAIVKLLDRCNNISTMAIGFTKDKIVQYIEETEAYAFPLLDHVKDTWPEYYNAAFLLKYHMKSILESLKRLV